MTDPKPDLPEGDQLDNLKAQLLEKDRRIGKLEAEIQQRDNAESARRTRRERIAGFAGEVGIKTVAGADVQRAAHESWDAWEAYLDAPSEQPVPKAETRNLAAVVLARLTKTRLIYLLFGLLSSGLLASQVWLLAQQNSRIDQQNELIGQQNDRIDRQNNLTAFEQTSALRDLLFLPPHDSLGNSIPNYHSIPKSELYGPYHYSWPQPNRSIVDQIVAFARAEPDVVLNALHPLVWDQAPPVAIGSLQVLGYLNRLEPGLGTIGLGPSHILYSRFGTVVGGRFGGADLNQLDLSDAHLSSADLREADLTSTNLRGAHLEDAYLVGARLLGADLSNSSLRRANLAYTDMRSFNLSNADLSGASLKNAYMLTGNRLDVRSIKGANIFCVRGAPEGFVDLALDAGAVIDDSPRRPLEIMGIICPPSDSLSQ